MRGILGFISTIAVFVVVCAFVTNISRVVLGARIGIVPYELHLAGAGVFAFLTLLDGKFWNLSRPSLLMLTWLFSLLAAMSASLILISNDNLAITTFTDITTFIAIAATFTFLSQNKSLLTTSGYAALLAILVSVVITYIEFYNPDFRIVRDIRYVTDADRLGPQRVAGLHVDPNANGTLMVLGLFVTQYFLARPLRFIYALLVGAAVVVTASRGSMILWLIVVFTSFWIGAYAAGNVIPKIMAFCLAIGLTLLLTSGQVPVILASTGLDEYMNPAAIERLSSGFLEQDDNSAEARRNAVSQNYEKFAQHPVFGGGLGISLSDEFSVGSHNMLLRMGSELGIIGILVYLSLLIVPLMARSRNGFLFVVFFYISNLFTHTAFSKPTFAILVPLAILYFVTEHSSTSSKRSRHPSRKRRRRRRSQPVPNSPEATIS